MILYSRPGCHLCDAMLEDLHAMDGIADCRINVVNIAGDHELEQQYGRRIPVLVAAASDRVLAEARLDRTMLVDYLSASS